jgi:hypothetical protein
MLRFSSELNDYISREFVKQRECGWIRPADTDAPEAILLWGTLGYAAFLSADGRVWMERDWLDVQSMREASAQERVGAFLKATDHHPLFLQQIPARPTDARSCPACIGHGRMPFKDVRGVEVAIWCGECEGLGWFLSDTD